LGPGRGNRFFGPHALRVFFGRGPQPFGFAQGVHSLALGGHPVALGFETDPIRLAFGLEPEALGFALAGRGSLRFLLLALRFFAELSGLALRFELFALRLDPQSLGLPLGFLAQPLRFTLPRGSGVRFELPALRFDLLAFGLDLLTFRLYPQPLLLAFRRRLLAFGFDANALGLARGLFAPLVGLDAQALFFFFRLEAEALGLLTARCRRFRLALLPHCFFVQALLLARDLFLLALRF
jgi:hypothetical protein